MKKKPALAVVFSSGEKKAEDEDPPPSSEKEMTGTSDLHKDPDVKQAFMDYMSAVGAEPDDEDAACEALVGLIELVCAKSAEGDTDTTDNKDDY
jgi:hypothetical protein